MIVTFSEEARASDGYNFLNMSKRETQRLVDSVMNVLLSMNPLVDVIGDFGAYSEEIVVTTFGDKKILGVARSNGKLKVYLLENAIRSGSVQLTESQSRVFANLLKGYIQHYDWRY